MTRVSRPFVAVLAVGCLAAAVLLLNWPSKSVSLVQSSAPAGVETAAATGLDPIGRAAAEPMAEPSAATVDSNAISAVVAEASKQALITSRVEELAELSMRDDSNALNTILSELTNADPTIRKAALEATIQFGSREAIPRLLEVAQQTDDAQERLALERAAEFLKLPSLTEVNKGATPRSGP